MTHPATRRTLLLAAGTTGAAALATGCGGNGGAGSAEGPRSVEGAGSAESPESTSPGTTAPGPPAGRELAATGDIPVGGGTVFRDEKVVVTQPEEGDFKAFSAICPHQSCLVADVSDGTINCPCHNSRFRIADGSVEQGPAAGPLPEERIAVEGNSIRLV